jgi:opacity protein-like surface antigen
VAALREVETMSKRTITGLSTSAAAAAALALLFAGAARAQDPGGDADIEAGATQASGVELGASASAQDDRSGGGGGSASGSGYSSGGRGGGGTRLALQLRLDAINVLALSEPDQLDSGPQPGRQLLVPLATPGVRLLDDGALFIGVGLGFANASVDTGPNEQSQTGWSLSPLISYDLVSDGSGALSLFGLVDLASLGETEECDPGGCMDQNDDAFGLGLGVGAGVRGQLTQGVALGGELGWGFLSIDRDAADEGDFIHGIFANLLFEASVGL